MQENDGLSMSADSWLLAQTSNLVAQTTLHRLVYVVNLNANVVNATVCIFLQEGCNRTLLAQWMQKLNLKFEMNYYYLILQRKPHRNKKETSILVFPKSMNTV